MPGVTATIIDLTPDDPRMRTDIAPLIHELRPDLRPGEFARFAAEAHRQGLVFTALYGSHGECHGVATHRVLATSRGRLLFVDDLVTSAARRSAGVGGRLVAELRARARAAGCVRIELDTGVTNTPAHRFYHARGLALSALHFSMDVLPGHGR